MRICMLTMAVAFCLTACGPTVQYIGKSYSPTNNVDIFFDTHDIKKDYTVMGKIDGVAGILNDSFQDIQNRILKEAQTKGADAVIIYNMEERVIGSASNSSTSWDTKTSNHRQWFDKGIMSTSSVSSNISQNVLHADFIKYNN